MREDFFKTKCKRSLNSLWLLCVIWGIKLDFKQVNNEQKVVIKLCKAEESCAFRFSVGSSPQVTPNTLSLWYIVIIKLYWLLCYIYICFKIKVFNCILKHKKNPTGLTSHLLGNALTLLLSPCWPTASIVEPCWEKPCNPLMLLYLVFNEAFDFQTQEASKDLTMSSLLFSLKETEILGGSLASVRVWNTTHDI